MWELYFNAACSFSRTSSWMEATPAVFSSWDLLFFSASASSDLTLSWEKESSGKASTAVTHSVESGWTAANPPETKYFLVSLALTTSTTPGVNCSTVGTWLARIPMEPDLAGKLTWTTSSPLNRVSCGSAKRNFSPEAALFAASA